MYAWEEAKNLQEALEKEKKLRQQEKERLQKIQKSEKSKEVFREWLKESLIRAS